MIELERTFLAKTIPSGLKDCRHKEIIDVYFPKKAEHPVVRLRKNGSDFELTKKTPIKNNDSSEQLEQTILLSIEEFNSFSALPGKRVAKDRYIYQSNGHTAEIDIFKEALEGLVLVDFEFDNAVEKNAFKKPGFCLVDVTQEKAFAGGMLCGKKYSDIEQKLEQYSYKKLAFK